MVRQQHLRILNRSITLALIFLLTTIGVTHFDRILFQFGSPAIAQDVNPVLTDVQALVNLGARVTGTQVAEKASQFLTNEYRQAGYEVKIQTFTYEKFIDLGTSLTVNGTRLEAWPLVGSVAGNPSGKLVAVPNFGRPDDFAKTNVKDAIALIKRGEIPFTEKVKNAAIAGAAGVIVVNNEPGNVRGILKETPKIPAIVISQEQGTPLFEQAKKSATVSLKLNTRPQALGRNVIAYKKGVTQPKLLVGSHYDSVRSSPGANDNASGTAVNLGLARQLATTPLANQIWFVAFDGEEDGLQGSRSFVKQAKPDFLKGLRGMMNFDMVGINDPLIVQGSPALFPAAKAITSNVSSSIMGNSDHASFNSQRVPVLFFHRGIEPNYHTPNDKTINSKLVADTQQMALRIIQQILKG
jgi:aminopeptidase YwaD